MGKKITKKRKDLLPKKSAQLLPPLLFPAKEKSDRAWMAKLKKEKRIQSIGPRLYASVPKQELAKLVRGNWSDIISQLFPNALLSYRSALEYKPTPDGDVYLTGTTNRTIEYPGLKLHFVRGPGRLEDDLPFLNFRSSSLPRALLENLSTTKATARRALDLEVIENKLETILQVKGEGELNQIRDRAKQIAEDFGWQREFEKLDQIIGSLLGTRSSENLISQSARARAIGKPYDASCIAKLDVLFAELRATPLPELKDNYKAQEHSRNKAFFEAYFSNYIEGTIFEIEEAEEIVFDQKIPEQRSKDGHDILGTFHLVSDRNEMSRTPKNFSEFQYLLKERHRTLMAARPEVHPGEYKSRSNRAGDTHFVQPTLVEGTLEKGFERYLNLPIGLSRAIFIMFLVAEVHPFTDGNGRVARIMMNADLTASQLGTIIIPNVYREDYLSALRALSRRERAEPLVRMLVRAQRFSLLEYSPYRKILKLLEGHNWFKEPSDAKLIEA